MKEKIKDTVVDLLLDGVKEKLDSVKENYKWQKLFVSTGNFFVNNPDVLVKFEDDLYSVFSKDNLIRIAKRLKDKNGYDFSQLLHNELYDLMVSYEIPIMETETYIHHFMQVIITYLEENDSDKALEMFLGDMRKEIRTYFTTLESKLELGLNQISNLNKEKITTYRYFEDADWSMPQEVLCEYECVMNKIVVGEKIYDYLYIFSHVYAFPLLNPIPYSKEENTEIHDQNYILREEEINARIKKFKEKGYSIDRLIQLAVKKKYDVVGEVLAQFYCDGVFDEKVFCSLMENDKEGKYVYDYVSYLYREGIIDLSEVIEKVKSISDNKNLLTNLISLEFVEDYENALIVKENEDIKRMYWGRNARLRISDKAEHELVSRLLYEEHSKMIIERTEPDELIYEDKGTIFSMLRGVIPISKIMVKSLNDEQKTKQIQLTDFQVGSGGICKMLYFNNGIKVKEYIMEINKMIYSHLNLDIVLELNNIDSVDKEYVAYLETVRGFGNMHPKIYFSSDEKIIITRVK